KSARRRRTLRTRRSPRFQYHPNGVVSPSRQLLARVPRLQRAEAKARDPSSHDSTLSWRPERLSCGDELYRDFRDKTLEPPGALFHSGLLGGNVAEYQERLWHLRADGVGAVLHRF